MRADGSHEHCLKLSDIHLNNNTDIKKVAKSHQPDNIVVSANYVIFEHIAVNGT